MTTPPRAGGSPASQEPAAPAIVIPHPVLEMLLQLLRLQTAQLDYQHKSLLSWQGLVIAAGQEAWDEAWDQWACRFGGGVPIGA